jgi:hypothetical protein
MSDVDHINPRRRIVMAKRVGGDMYYRLDGKLFEIKRQLRQKDGYPYSLEELDLALQRLVEGRLSPRLAVATITTIPELSGGLTSDFDEVLLADESDILPVQQGSAPECRVTTWDVSPGGYGAVVADTEIVKQLIYGEEWCVLPRDDSAGGVAKTVLNFRKWTMTLPQIRWMAEETCRGGFTGLAPAGENTLEDNTRFAFFAKGKKKGQLIVGEGEWASSGLKHVFFRPFGSAFLGYNYRLLLPHAPRRVTF